MKLLKANRKNSFIRIGLSGPAGCGKTYSSILIARGMLGSLDQVAVIDSEKGSGNLYSDLGNYSIIKLNPPYNPEDYINAINIAEESGIKVLIIDSLSHAWEATIEKHANLTGNSFKNWGFVKSKFKQLIDRILSADMHVIATFRTKTDYVINADQKGNMKPEKVGLKSITSEESDYEFTILFELNLAHMATCTKDRTQLFSDNVPLLLGEGIGSIISTWCDNISLADVKLQLLETHCLEDLKSLYDKYIDIFPSLQQEFTKHKQSLPSINLNHHGNYLS